MSNYLKSFLNKATGRQFMTMVLIGAFNTVVDFGLVKILLDVVGWSKYPAVTTAFVTATGFAYVLNKRFTFGERGLGGASETSSFFLVNLIALALTNGAIFAVDQFVDEMGSTEVLLTKVAVTGAILLPKFASYRDIVFGGRSRRS